MSKVGVHLIAEGRVQGVGFRYFSQRAGVKHNIKGYVLNLVNGNVEIVAEGEKEDMDRFVYAIEHEHPYAKVTRIIKKDLPYTGNYQNFNIKY